MKAGAGLEALVLSFIVIAQIKKIVFCHILGNSRKAANFRKSVDLPFL